MSYRDFRGFRRPIRANYAICSFRASSCWERILCSLAVGSMASGSDPPKQYGITKPLSLLGPVEADLQRTAELEKVCD